MASAGPVRATLQSIGVRELKTERREWKACQSKNDRGPADTKKSLYTQWREGCSRRNRRVEKTMLHWSLVFLVIALIAAVFGFAGIAGAAAGVAKILFVVFLAIWLIAFMFGRRAV